MSSSDENSDRNNDLELGREFLEETYDNGNNDFAFGPEYPEHEVDERLRVSLQEREGDNGNEPLVIADPGDLFIYLSYLFNVNTIQDSSAS